MYTYKYPRPAVTVDIITLSEKGGTLYILLIRRKNEPFKGGYAFPGGFVDKDEDLYDAAKRELEEETGLKVSPLIPFRAFGTPGRDPRGHTVGAVYYTFLDEECPSVQGYDDAEEACWFSLDKIPSLAFDHHLIVEELVTFLSKGFYSEPLTSDWLAHISDRQKRQRIRDYFLQKE